MPERLMTIRVHMPQLNRDRNVRIYLPPDYFANLGRRYPVLYMHDGQNLFEPSKLSGFSWEVNQTLDRLFKLDPKGMHLLWWALTAALWVRDVLMSTVLGSAAFMKHLRILGITPWLMVKATSTQSSS